MMVLNHQLRQDKCNGLSWTIWNGLGNWSDTETLVQYLIDICILSIITSIVVDYIRYVILMVLDTKTSEEYFYIL